MLLTQAALGPLRQFFPGRASAAVRPGARRPARTRGVAGGRPGRRARPHRGRHLRRRAGRAGPPLRRPRLDGQPGAAPGHAGLPGGRGHGARGRRSRRPLDWRDAERVRFAVGNLVDALAPSNSPLLSPEAWKAAIDSGGGSLVTGARHLVSDLSSAPRVPAMVPPDAYTVGTDLAATPGAVVLRTPVVRADPVPAVNGDGPRAPAADRPADDQQVLRPRPRPRAEPDRVPGRPGAAGVRDVLAQPGRAARLVGVRRVRARPSSRRSTPSRPSARRRPSTCSAPAPAASWPAWPPRCGRPSRARRASRGWRASGCWSPCSTSHGRTPSAPSWTSRRPRPRSPPPPGRATWTAAALAEVFAWLRPGDLIWNYWVNNYLLGREPARFDILFWNADTTRMTAGLHRDFVRAALANSAGRARAGSPCSAPRSTWPGWTWTATSSPGWPTTSAPGSPATAAASCSAARPGSCCPSSGHIAALVNPPGNKKSRYQVSDDVTADAGAWQQSAATEQGSWWPDYASWLAARSGGQVAGPGRARRRRLPGHRARPWQLRAGGVRARSGPRQDSVRGRAAAAGRGPPRRRRRPPAAGVQRHRHPARGPGAVHRRA